MGLVEFAAGWALGAKSGESHFEEVVDTAKGVVNSQEVADLLHAVRAHVGYSLKELGGLLMGDDSEPKAGDDLLDIVRLLVQRRDGAAAAGPIPPLQIVRDARREKRGAV
jgi:hypothetical protein